MAQLQELRVDDFTGGLNTQGTQFTLGQNESPSMLNIEIDDRKGFRTRKGWNRWNAANITGGTWAPRNTHAHHLSDGTFLVYLANDGDTYAAPGSGVFADVSIPNGASPHLADFASWGDVCYFACGKGLIPYKRNGTSAAASLIDTSTTASAGGVAFNDDYTTPTGGEFVVAEVVEAHAGYMFVAHTREGGTNAAGVITSGTVHPNRIRWSHPSQPEDWATNDYIDISSGGGAITALMSFRDHLLIFKTDSMWALYGYDSDSWQLVQVSRSVGVLSPEAVARSESAVFFYSPSDGGGVYGYDGSSPTRISDNIRKTIDEITAPQDAWVAWTGNRLWCSLPWTVDDSYVTGDSTVMVFDPVVGNGAWIAYAPASGNIRSIIEGSDISNNPPLAVLGGAVSCVMELEVRGQASDGINVDGTTFDPFTAYYVTRWYNAGSQELRKSWRRPRFIMTQEDAAVKVVIYTYHNYNEASSKRSHTIETEAQAAAIWNAFNWGDGSLWGASDAAGSTIERAEPAAEGLSGLGVARSVQLKFVPDVSTAGNQWGISAFSLKYLERRFTT